MALRLKEAGLRWFVHVGCFAWDAAGVLIDFTPLPNSVYFILNLSIFARALGGVDQIHRKLVWLPTWHQARLLCREHGVPDEAVAAIWSSPMGPGDELPALYAAAARKAERALKDKPPSLKMRKTRKLRTPSPPQAAPYCTGSERPARGAESDRPRRAGGSPGFA